MGCPGAPDTLTHYVNECPCAERIVAAALGRDVPAHPLLRLGLISPAPPRNFAFVVAYFHCHRLVAHRGHLARGVRPSEMTALAEGVKIAMKLPLRGPNEFLWAQR